MKPEHEELVAPLAAFLALRTRSMFGGLGLYHAGLFFGLVHEGALYLRVPPAQQAACRHAGSTPFQPPGGRPARGTYWHVPEPVLRDRRELRQWAERALADAAARGTQRRKR